VAAITLTSVSRVAAGATLLNNVSLHVAQGELVVLVGPSGAGKTSLIRAVAGLDKIDSGSVFFDEEDVTGVEVAKRDVGIVFESNTLFPRHNVRRNISFPLRIRSMRRDVINTRVTAEARSLGIEEVLERWPSELSAGHAQLAQIARAMVRVPRVLLLDEPMAHLDTPNRVRLRRELRELQRGYGVTTIYATNDPAEAVFMADRMVALENGSIQQIGEPGELYTAPANVHIAWLTGPVSFLDAAVEPAGQGFWLVGDGFRIRAWPPKLADFINERVRVGIRPESLRLLPESRLRATIDSTSFETGTPVTRVRIGDSLVAMKLLDLPKGTELGVSVDRCLVFEADGRLISVVG
jgi:ABC-type sugar transport system ATPase subunit